MSSPERHGPIGTVNFIFTPSPRCLPVTTTPSSLTPHFIPRSGNAGWFFCLSKIRSTRARARSMFVRLFSNSSPLMFVPPTPTHAP